MSYVTPPTFVAADPLAAADLNILGDDIAFLKAITDGLGFSGADVSRTASTNTTSGSALTVSWTAETYDYGSWYSAGTNIVVPAGAIPAGYTTIAILVSCQTSFASNSAGYRRISVLKNGSSYTSRKATAINGDTTDLDITRLFTVVAGDTIALEAYQNSGSTVAISSTQLTCVRFAPVA